MAQIRTAWPTFEGVSIVKKQPEHVYHTLVMPKLWFQQCGTVKGRADHYIHKARIYWQ